jgi:hypothetical protein
VTVTRFAALWGVLLALAPGCLSRAFIVNAPGGVFVPARPAAALAGPLMAQLERVEVVTGSDQVTVALGLRAARAALIADARLSSSASPPCAAGVSAGAFALDAQARWDRPVGVTGPHDLVLAFAGAAALLAQPDAVIDLAVGEPTTDATVCVRVALGADTGTGAPVLRPARAWSIGGVLRTAAPTSRGPTRWIDDEIRVTRAVGPLALGAEAGWAEQVCPTSCGFTPSLAAPLWAVAELVAARRGGLGLGVEAAYGMVFGLGGFDEIQHGPRLSLHVLELPPSVWGARAPSARGLEISLSYERSLVGPIPAAWVVGFGGVAF